jgi:transcription initiation factor TFIIIB Brf1 subunit/transcription initiation factor TFIIB
MLRRLTKEQKELINGMFEEGLTTSEIAKKLNLSYSMVYYQRPEVREKIRRYFQRPEVRERERKCKRKYYIRKILPTETLSQKYGEEVIDKIFQEYSNLKMSRKVGKGMAFIASVTYSALRKCGKPVVLEDIIELFGVDEKEVVNNLWRIYGDVNNTLFENPKDYIERKIDDLNFPEDKKEAVLNFYENNEDILKKFAPRSSAAACLYVVSEKYGLGITREKIAWHLKTNVRNIRKIVKVLKENNRL